MKRWLKRISLATCGAFVAAAITYLIAIASFSRIPDGKYASWQFFPHDTLDVLHFESGVVTLETCCGNEDHGHYTQNPDGSWTWSLQRSFKRTPTSPVEFTPISKFKIERRLFHLRIQSLDDPKLELDMRRRLFNDLPI